MNLRKMIPTLLGALAICVLLPLAPNAGHAAEVTSIETPKAGDTQLWVTFTNGKVGDAYEIYVNGTKVNSGTLSGEITNPDRMYFNLTYVSGDGTEKGVAAGDKIELRMQNGSEMISHEVTVASDADPNPPTTMTVESNKVAQGDAVFATLVFDKDYVPNADDKVIVMRYDKDGKDLGMYTVDLPDVYDGSVKVQLKDSAETAYYTLTFLSGGETVNLPSVRVDVTEGGDSGTTEEPDQDQQEILDKAVSMTFSYPSSTVSLGESVTPTIQLTDAAGNTYDYTGSVIFSYSGDAVAEGTFDANGRFTVGSEQSYIGTKIQVTAMVGSFSRTVELTVQAGDKSLILTPDSGSTGNARAVTFQLADGSGNRLRLVWEPTVAEVVIKPTDSQSTAKMAGTVTNLSSLTTNGSGTMLISSDEVADAQLYIIFRDNSGRFYQTALTNFSFTESTGENEMSLQLNINSNSYSVNGITYTADTKPVVQDNRTFVPYRLLAEALGGAVTYDNSTQTITTVDGGTSIIMTIGSTNYTVNGTPATMDVAPFINSDNRTMVPLRFLAEALGCKVTPQYAANGTTTIGVLVER
ncbi:MAG: copper amine oxidase N-terminal domain-containing protein [Peptococcaceae bacterium]|nr:copper amine oxidase N-terminal domain-containing protein [Peptococcaceae bacterium]